MVQPASVMLFSQVRLTSAITILCPRVVVHSHLAGTSQAVGISMRVGKRTFSIVGGLGFVVDQFRGFVRLQLAGLVLRWLHMRRMLEEVWERLNSRWRLVEGLTGKGQ